MAQLTRHTSAAAIGVLTVAIWWGGCGSSGNDDVAAVSPHGADSGVDGPDLDGAAVDAPATDAMDDADGPEGSGEGGDTGEGGPDAPLDADAPIGDASCGDLGTWKNVGLPDQWHSLAMVGAITVAAAGDVLLVGGKREDLPEAPQGAPILSTFRINAMTGATSSDKLDFPCVSGAGVWTGSEVLVWGCGDEANWGGAGTASAATMHRFDPVANAWTNVDSPGVPPPRTYPAAVWTGARAIFWGGSQDSVLLGDGGQFDPVAGTWSPISAAAGPSPRVRHSVAWTGTRLLVWGGFRNDGAALGDGASYDPVADAWTPLASAGAPSPRAGHSAIWTGEKWMIWGGGKTAVPGELSWVGNDLLGDGALYDPATDTWERIPSAGAPSPRARAGGVWTGSAALISGGYDKSTPWSSTGATFDPVAKVWCPISTVGAPTFSGDQMVWAGDRALTWYDGAWTFVP